MTVPDWLERDRAHLWHPYTDITTYESATPLLIERGEGAFLIDREGRRYLDGIASWWCVNLGHGHPRLVEAIRAQAGVLQHAILGGQAHPGAVELAARLAQLAPGDLSHVHFASDGACAVEAALKIALQHWTNLGVAGRTRFIGLEDGYHGDTLGAMSVGYVEAFHRPFEPALRPSMRAESPHCARCRHGLRPEDCDLPCFASMERLARAHRDEVAAVIVEPLCQGAAGVRIYPVAYLRRLRELCDRTGLLLIADEIAVGLGRTGAWFACDHAGVVPDLMTLGKGLTGGYLPMSATLVTGAVYDGFRRGPDGRPRTFFHGHTFGGNPIAAAAALAALDVSREEDLPARARALSPVLAEGMERLGRRLEGSYASTLGLIGMVELNESAGGAPRARRIADGARERGLLVRPLGPVIYLWPPLNVAAEHLAQMLSILEDSVAASG